MDQVRRFLHERSELRDAFDRAQLEIDTTVHASLPEVPEEIRFVVVLPVQPMQVAQVVTELPGSNRGIVPTTPHRPFAVRRGDRRPAGIANVPEFLLPVPVIEDPDL